ncbi:hypothetical protein MG293_012023 [Ovis ammon polii]|uniref:Uncharacterized protein n=1 Tax=Ovis ammon polii TaxID=230172 RepID=A0AAD4U6T5_OVIAM|nr:hypothetical protein MG293_012023 [Ovis ammon polii]
MSQLTVFPLLFLQTENSEVPMIFLKVEKRKLEILDSNPLSDGTLSSEGYATEKGRTVLTTSSQGGPEQVRDFLERVARAGFITGHQNLNPKGRATESSYFTQAANIQSDCEECSVSPDANRAKKVTVNTGSDFCRPDRQLTLTLCDSSKRHLITEFADDPSSYDLA